MPALGRILGVFAIVLAAALGGRLLPEIRAGIPSEANTSPRQEAKYGLAFFDGSRGRLVVLDTSGRTLRDDAIGGTAQLASLSRDGTRVAMWREAAGSGRAIELIVREIATGKTTVLTRAVEESPVSAPVWDGQGIELVVGLATLPAPDARTPSAPPRSSRLVLFLADGSSQRDLATIHGETLVPVARSRDVVSAFVGLPGQQRYVVVDVQTGSVRREARSAEFQAHGVDPARGWVFGVTKPDLPGKPEQTLRIWSIHDYGTNVVEVRSPTINAAVAWPGRDLVAFGTSTRIEVVHATTGAIRNLLADDVIVVPHAFTPDGSQLPVKRLLAPNWRACETAGDTLGAGEAITVPAGLNEPIGWTR